MNGPEGTVNTNGGSYYEHDPWQQGWVVPDAAREWMGEGV